MYLPFRQPDDVIINKTYQAVTSYFGGEPNCKPLLFGHDYHLTLWQSEVGDDFVVNITDSQG